MKELLFQKIAYVGYVKSSLNMFYKLDMGSCSQLFSMAVQKYFVF